MTLFTDDFSHLAKFVAESRGLPGLPLAFVEHPLTNTPVDAAKQKVRRPGFVDEVAAALTQAAGTLEETYRSRIYPARRNTVCR